MLVRGDGTFTYRGREHRAKEGPYRDDRGGSYSIERAERDGDWTPLADGFGSVLEIQDYVDEAAAGGWELWELWLRRRSGWTENA